MDPNPNPSLAPAVANASDAVKLPALLLLISGVLGGSYALFTLCFGRVMTAWALKSADNYPQLSELARVARQQDNSWHPSTFVFWGLLLSFSALVVVGALRLRELRSYPLAVAAAVLSLLPCAGCCCVGLPAGIWALVVLMNPEIKSQFR